MAQLRLVRSVERATLLNTFDEYLWPLQHVALGGVLLASSILLHRMAQGWSTRLMLIGSIAYLLVWLHNFAFQLAFAMGWIRLGTFWTPTDTENQLITQPFQIIECFEVCFPIGLLWYAVTRRKT